MCVVKSLPTRDKQLHVVVYLIYVCTSTVYICLEQLLCAQLILFVGKRTRACSPITSPNLYHCQHTHTHICTRTQTHRKLLNTSYMYSVYQSFIHTSP